jgi:DNA-binding MarR family transcriptional regulator
MPGLRRFRRTLTPRTVRILSCLNPDTVHSIAQIAEHLALSRSSVTALVGWLTRMKLVTKLSVVRSRLVAITALGLAHPDRDAGAAKVPALDLIRSLGETRADFIEALGVLGEARSIDVTAAVRTAVREPRQPGFLMHVLWATGIAERIDGTPPGKQPCYRLTDTGRRLAAHIARLRPPPMREHLEAKISAYKASRPRIWGAQLRRRLLVSVPTACAGAQSPAQARILDALEAGPLSTAELRRHIADLHQHPYSVLTTLVSLASRGAIREVGSRRIDKVWTLSDRTRRPDAAIHEGDCNTSLCRG